MTMVTPPMTMTVSAPMIQAASRSVAVAASGSREARAPVSVMGDAEILASRGRGVHGPDAGRCRQGVLDFRARRLLVPTNEPQGGSDGAIHQGRGHRRPRSGRGEVRRGG